jgi:GDP-4-dehydro-6-deoxy-D-mannose reductase
VGPLLARAVADAWPRAERFVFIRKGESTAIPGWSCLSGDLCEPTNVDDAFRTARPDLVLHLAAQSSVGDAINGTASTWRVNSVGSFNIATAIATYAPDATVLFTSSSEVYGRSFSSIPVDENVPPQPLNSYARSKLAAEGLLGDISPKTARLIIVRPFNHTGPGQDVRFALPSFASQIIAVERGLQEYIRVGNLEAARDFLDVNDVIDAYLGLLTRSNDLPQRSLFNISSGNPRQLSEILKRMLSLSSAPCEIKIDPNRMRPSDVPVAVGNSLRLQEATGWRPRRAFSITLAQLLQYWRDLDVYGS